MLRPREQVTFVRLHLRAPDAVFVFGSYTVPTWRGHRLMTQLSRFAAATYAGQGFHRICSAANQATERPCVAISIAGTDWWDGSRACACGAD